MNNLSEIPALQTNSQQPSVEEIVNALFDKLTASSPILLATDERRLSVLKKQWILGFVENGIRTVEQVQDGMKFARKKEDSYLPSIGEFIGYCKQGQLKRLGLPSFDELKYRLKRFRDNGGFYEIDRFEFMSDVEYWLITDLANKSIRSGYSEAEELKAMKTALDKMAKRLTSGEPLPKRVITLPEESTVKPHNPQAVARFFNRPELKF